MILFPSFVSTIKNPIMENSYNGSFTELFNFRLEQ